ncbi:MAG: serine hydrolase [Candidatus Paceibacterota bacterium]|jgi:D-alanyl-D-alanine carboxypeptidase (penicillin-binding protein 5/6)
MNIADLQHLAKRTRSMREASTALLFSFSILALFFFMPISKIATPTTPTGVLSPVPDAFAHIPLEAKAAIVYDLVTGETLYGKNADDQLPLASLTKLLTVYAALSKLSPNTPITISDSATQLGAPHAFSTGQTFALDDLARLTLTASLNDGATAIAEATAALEGNSQNEMLAGAAAALELSQTYAVNGSGLDVNGSVAGGYGSAYDLARLSGAFVAQSPTIAAATTEHSAQAISKEGKSFSVINTDPMINTIPHLLLSKTGYTDLAGGNLVLVFDSGIGHPIAVVVLGSSQKARFTDGSTLVAATLAHFAGVASL